MDTEFKVIDIDPGRFSQTPRCDSHLNKEVISKMGLTDGDLIEIKGKRTTVARVFSADKNSFGIDTIGLNNVVRNNAMISLEDTISIVPSSSKIAKKIVLAPIEKHLRKSELIKGLAKKSYQGAPFIEGDVTFLRSKMLRYLLGSVTWLKVVKTDPSGVVVAGEDTEFEIIPDPVNNTASNQAFYFSDTDSDDFNEKDLSLTDAEWVRLNSLLEVGLFKNLSETLTFLVREGIKSREDVFKKTESVMEQLKELKKDIKIS